MTTHTPPLSIVGLRKDDALAISGDVDQGVAMPAATAQEVAADIVNLGRYEAEQHFQAAGSALPHAADGTPTPMPQALGPIERDESMDRTYIPLPGGWEVQTQGKGSSFRLCNTESGHRWIVTDKHLHPVLEEMARDIHATILAAAAPQKGEA